MIYLDINYLHHFLMKILFLSTDINSQLSVMAGAFLLQTDKTLEILFAGFHPAARPNSIVISVMSELGIDISSMEIKDSKQFEGQEIDYLITIGNGTTKNFTAEKIISSHKIHLEFNNPEDSLNTDEQLLNIYRDIRDEIRNELDYFYSRILLRNSPRSQRLEKG